MIKVKPRDYVGSAVSTQGEPSSGKSMTLAILMVMFWKACKSKLPAVWVESEYKFAENLAPFFDEHKVPVKNPLTGQPGPVESRDFTELCHVLDECNNGFADCLGIDSITHFAEDLTLKIQLGEGAPKCPTCGGSGRSKGLRCIACAGQGRLSKFMGPSEWGKRNDLWQRNFNDLYLASPLNVFMTGRLGPDFHNVVEEYEEGGVTKSKVTLVSEHKKMRAGKDTGYEADAILEMFSVQRNVGVRGVSQKSGKKLQLVTNKAVVIKVPPFVPAEISLGAEIMLSPNDHMLIWEKFGKPLWNHRQRTRKAGAAPPAPTAMMPVSGNTSDGELELEPEFESTPRARGEGRQVRLNEIESALDFVYSGSSTAAKESRAAFLLDNFQTTDFQKVRDAWELYPTEKLETALLTLQELSTTKRQAMRDAETVPPTSAPKPQSSAPIHSTARPPAPTSAAPRQGAPRVVRRPS